MITFSDNNFRLIFCDVGQGDGIYIRTPKGHDIVIDGGPDDFSMSECLVRHMPIWDREIDIVFLTHPDSDHLTGLINVLKSYSVKEFATSKAPKDTDVFNELLETVEREGLDVKYLTKGDRLETTDGLVMTVEWPTEQFVTGGSSDSNEYSLVHFLKYGSTTALLTGDVTSVYLNSIMPIIGHAGIFKSPHHGSKTGVDEFTFEHNTPDIAVISAGKNNSYGHPSREVLGLFKEKGIPYVETKNGDIEFVSDGKVWQLKN